MKIQLIISCLACMLCLMSCNRKTAIVEEQPEPKEELVELAPEPVVSAPLVVEAPASYRMLGLKRGGCFGKCPMFSINFFSDGTVTYEGKKYVEKIGTYEAKMDKSQMTDLVLEARKINFFDLSDTYPEDKQFINDLPTHEVFHQIGDQTKKIRDNYGAPSELKAFEELLERSIDGLTWTKIK